MALNLVRDFIPYNKGRESGQMPKIQFPKDPSDEIRVFVSALKDSVAKLEYATSHPDFLDEGGVIAYGLRQDALDEATDILEILRVMFPNGEIDEAAREKRNQYGSFVAVAMIDDGGA